MTEAERFGNRDLTYSQWHRSKSLSRYVGQRAAYECSVIDIDWCEYCRRCKKPLALIETTMGPRPKPATVTTHLGLMADLPVLSLAYEVDDHGQITVFHLQHLAPERENQVFTLTSGEWAMWLVGLRERHGCVTDLRATA